ncbi:aromatic acid/H+ symport family MFS transporter [Pseudomonas sp. 1912-s]|uniref:MFS transporter n=1 Tax=Pseudomonas sp. 1912-s TaxID=3033802 RepID=UPI0023DEFF82|nr:aromatic acid/H+ symport family MFS transporter [Pseudomonas sp. 1912-s]MDF3201808.1 aromatic acid/H+ symport family MFS transporter [Pseudomonas sp. 1912-s]
MSSASMKLQATDRLERSQILIVLCCFAVAMVDGFDTLMLSFIAPLLVKAWDMPHGLMGQVFSIGYLGAVIGAFTIGSAADRYGRKKTLVASLCVITVFTLLCATASSPYQLMFYRFIAGLGLGGAIPAITALTAENVPPSRRSTMITLMFLGFPLGAVVGGTITSALLSTYGWEVVFVMGGIGAVCVILPVIMLLPETLQKERGITPQQRLLSSAAIQFADGRLLPALLMWAAVFMLMVATYFLVSWTPTILTQAGLSPAKAAIGGVVLNLGGILGAIGMSFIGARRSLFFPAATALVFGCFMVWLIGQNMHNVNAVLPLIFFAGLGVIGGQLTFPALAARLFPANVRGAGVGFLMGIGRMGSILGPLIGGTLLSMQLPWNSLYLVAACPVLLAALAVVLTDRVRPHTDNH